MNAVHGTWTLVRLALRLDRVKLPVWILALSGVTLATASAFQELYPTVAGREQFGLTVSANPALQALLGPLFEPRAIGGLTAWRVTPVLVLAGLMGLQTVVRHTRTEEESGRLELVGSAVVGRHAPLTAALIVTGAAGAAVGALSAGGLISLGLDVTGAVALGLAYTATVWSFAAVASVTAQVTSSARAANGMAGAVLGAAFLLRAVGDSAASDSALSGLVWASPLGWSQQLRPFADERWWVLGVVAAFVVVLAAAGYALRARRDTDAGLVAERPGPATAGATLGSPLGLAWRLQRAALVWWAVGAATAGAVIGAVARDVGAMVDQSPQMAALLEQLGGAEAAIDSFIATVLGIIGMVAAVYAVQSTLRLRTEEAELRAEQVLATAVRRLPWALSHLVIVVAGTTVVLLAAGVAAGLVDGLRAGDVGARVPAVVGGALAQLPAALVLAGIALLLFGVVPHLTTMAWGVLAATLLISQLGPVLQLEQWILDLAPSTHVPQLPGAELTWEPLLWLTLVAVGTMTAGLVGLRRRDIG